MTETSLADYGLPEGIHGDEALFFDRIGEGLDVGRSARRSLVWALAASAVFGATLGAYGHSAAQVLSSTIKVPLLLLGTTALCFPTFHVLQGLRATKVLSLGQSLALHAHALCMSAVVWAGLSIPLFFLVATTQHYALAQALALSVGASGGIVGALRLEYGYRRLCQEKTVARRAIVLVPYVAIYGLVGAQLAWVLRPFIGSPSLPFQLFRSLDGSFFGHLARMLGV